MSVKPCGEQKEYQRKEREEERGGSLIIVGILLTGW
jgi:hypothetical protein